MIGSPVLDVRNIVVRFGGVVALNRASLRVNGGEIVSLIGPNGAGKTTMFNAIAGVVKPVEGTVRFLGTPVDGYAPHERARLGMARTFQQGRLFRRLTLRENFQIACHGVDRVGAFRSALASPRARRVDHIAQRRAAEMIETLGLGSFADLTCADLPHGIQRLGELGRALCTSPRLLLLDEVAAGLDQHESSQLAETVVRIRDDVGIPILLIEHDMSVVMSISDYVYVLDFGTPLADGTPVEIGSHPAVVAAYLGDEHEHKEDTVAV